MALFLTLSSNSYSRDYIIYSIDHELPMGEKDETISKNFYVNIGEDQGLQQGTVLDVYRVISKLNPYDNKRRVNYKVKIGELEVLHADKKAAIAINKKEYIGEKYPIFDIEAFMVGDHVTVNTQ